MKRKHPFLESPEVRSKRAHLRRENALYSDTFKKISENQWPEGYGRSPTTLTLAVWRSRRYLVQIVKEMHKEAHRLSVNCTELNEKGDSWKDGITWDELMEIKRQCGFESSWAIEIYPPDHHIVNVANMRHLWLLDAAPACSWTKKQLT